MGKYHIELDTYSKVQRFVSIAEKCGYDVKITNASNKYIGNAKSIINVIAALEWGDIYVTSDENNCYRDFEQFITEE